MSLVDQFLQDNECFEEGYNPSQKNQTETENIEKQNKPQPSKAKHGNMKFYGDSDSESEEEEAKDEEQENLEDDQKEDHEASENEQEEDEGQDEEKDVDEEEQVQDPEESEEASEIKPTAYQRRQQHKYSFSSSEEEGSEEQEVAEVSIDESKISHQEDGVDTSRKSNQNYTEQENEDAEEEGEDNEQEGQDSDNEANSNNNDEEEEEEDANQDPNGDEEIDFYQLSDMENSQIGQDPYTQSSKNYKEKFEDVSPKKAVLQSSIAKVASLLDSQVTNYDKVFSSSVGPQSTHSRDLIKPSQEQIISQAKPDTEMTFGDLSSSEASYDEQRQNRTKLAQIANKYDRSRPVHQATIYEEDGEDGSGSLMYSQFSQYQPHQSFNNSQITKINAPQPEIQNLKNLKIIALRSLFNRSKRVASQKTFNQWKDYNTKEFYNIKLKNAAQMVDKMSRFSRNFISLNSLNSILQKNKQRQIAKAMIKWARAVGGPSQQLQQTQSVDKSHHQAQLVEELNYLRAQLETKVKEISKMELMFKEYSNWRTKLEQIELKMKSEVDYWKSSCDKLQSENSELQKEALKVTQALMERTKLLEAKENTIEQLQKKLKATKAALDPVEEAFCPNCKNSLEESQVFGKDTFNQLDMQLVRELNDKLMDLEKQVMTYRERVSYHESVEDELKNNIESQVDVVLKMEEERLLLLKENRDIKDKNNKLVFDNEDLKEKINIFEKELEELQNQFKQQQQKQQQQSVGDTSTTTFDQDSQWTQSTISNQKAVVTASNSNNKENKNLINKKKPLAVKSNKTITTGVKKQSSQLKFQSNNGSALKSTFNDQASQVVNSLRLSTITDDFSGKSKAGQEPVNKQLVSDNQVLTNELIVMNREISKLKAELRISQESLKKSEKEKYDAKKNLEGKDTAVEKLRREKDELWAIVNTDKYKNIKTIEQEKEKSEKYKIELQTNIEQLKLQIDGNEQQQQILKEKVTELEYSNQKFKEKEVSRDKLLETLEAKSQKYEKDYDQCQSQLQVAKRDLEQAKIENAQHKKDLEWLANSAKKNKMSADRAIADLEAYTQILRGMEKKLAGVEIEKEAKEAELQEVKQKFMIQMSAQIQNQSSYQSQQQPPQTYQKLNSQYQTQQYIQQPQGIQQQQPQWSNQQLSQTQQQQHNFQQQPQQQRQQFPGQQQQQNQAPQRMNSSGGAPQPQKPPQRFI